MTKIKVIQIGCGKMSKYTMRYVYDHGGEIVGAIDSNPNFVGTDIGSVMGLRNKQIIIEPADKLDEVLKITKPNIAIVTTMSLLNDLRDTLRILVNNKVNVITTCEEAFFAQNSNKQVYKEIDTLAKANGVTVVGCGYQDVFWGNLISVIAGSTNKITKVKGISSYNVEDYGISLAKAHGVGLTNDEFARDIANKNVMSDEEREQLIDKGKFNPSYMWNTIGWLADKLNFEIDSMKQECIPITCEKLIHSKTLKMDIKPGCVIGMSAKVTGKTIDGITLEAECVGKIYDENEFDKNEWTIYGEPDTTVTINKPSTVELTCADIVNRIPDIINGKPGFISTSELPIAHYLKEDLDYYVR